MLAPNLLEPAWEIFPGLAFQNKQLLKTGKKRENYNFLFDDQCTVILVNITPIDQ